MVIHFFHFANELNSMEEEEDFEKFRMQAASEVKSRVVTGEW